MGPTEPRSAKGGYPLFQAGTVGQGNSGWQTGRSGRAWLGVKLCVEVSDATYSVSRICNTVSLIAKRLALLTMTCRRLHKLHYGKSKSVAFVSQVEVFARQRRGRWRRRRVRDHRLSLSRSRSRDRFGFLILIDHRRRGRGLAGEQLSQHR